MASVKLSDGFFKIVTHFFENLCKIRIPGEARQVLDLIIRKTWGWQKKYDYISLKQFVDGTGLVKSHICRNKEILIKMNMILCFDPNEFKIINNGENIEEITQKGNDSLPKKVTDGLIYCIQKDYDKWLSLPKKVTLPKKVMVITQKGNDSLPKKVTDGLIYCIQKDYDKWLSLPKKVTLPKKVMVITQKGNETLPKKVHTKDNKDTIQKNILSEIEISDQAIKFSNILAESILVKDPLYFHLQKDKKEKTLNSWAKDIDKINRINKRSWDEIEDVLNFIIDDKFWSKNILSGSKFRAQFDQVKIKMNNNNRQDNFSIERPKPHEI